MRGEQARAHQVVVDRILDGHHLRLADVDADHRAGGATPLTGDPRRRRLGAGVVEAHPIDDREIAARDGTAAASGCRAAACAVIVPTSTWPKPRAPRPAMPSASLSKPAASPNGDGNSSPRVRTACAASGRGERARQRAQQRPAEDTDDHEGEMVGELGVEAREDEPEEESVHADPRLVPQPASPAAPRRRGPSNAPPAAT